MQPARQRVLPCFVDVFDLMVPSYGCLDVRLARMASNVQPNCGTLLTLTLVLKVTLRLLGGVQRQQRLWCAPFCIHNCTHKSKHCVRGLTRFDSHRAVQHAALDIARAERTRCGRDRGSGACFSTAGVAALQPLTRVTNRHEQVESQHPPRTVTVWPTLEQPPRYTEAALPIANGRRTTPCARLPRARYNPSALSLR